jgi:hypothetical protein
MHKQRVLCNGQATGQACVHYWNMIRMAPSHNPDFLKQGEKLRFCRAWGIEPLEFGEGTTELATMCSMYQPDPTRPYDVHFEDYTAIEDEELVQIGTTKPSPALPIPNAPMRNFALDPVSAPAPDTSPAPAFTAADAVQEPSDD